MWNLLGCSDVQDCWAGWPALWSDLSHCFPSCPRPQAALPGSPGLWTGSRHPGDCGYHVPLEMSLTFSHLPLHQAAIGGGSKAEHKRLTAIGLKHRCPFGEGHSWWLVRRLTAKSAHYQACQPELDPWNPQGRRGKPIAASCPLTFTCAKIVYVTHAPCMGSTAESRWSCMQYGESYGEELTPQEPKDLPPILPQQRNALSMPLLPRQLNLGCSPDVPSCGSRAWPMVGKCRRPLRMSAHMAVPSVSRLPLQNSKTNENSARQIQCNGWLSLNLTPFTR